MATPPFSHRPPRSWRRIEINAAAVMTDSISGFLAEITGSGVEISAPAVDAPEPVTVETITGYLADDEERVDKELAIVEFLKQLPSRFPGAGAPKLTASLLQEEDWGQNWKKHFKPIRITPRITIKPSWEEYSATADEIVIEMDPGMAFGTGHHASTRLALQFIDACYDTATPPQRVLDVGTGTGVLGMACAMFGASEVLAIDNDPDAVAAAHENIQANNLADRMMASDRDLSVVQCQFDLVIANITSNVLTELAGQLCGCMATAGQLILAGILAGEQEQGILQTYTGMGLQHLTTSYQDEWASLHFARA
ncbi:MAG: 50S ribosomal protein L11 methyltransferase [Desulfobulbaceae bacterium]|nr:50S ribosomal protein L11 methyltransferase [Desulfobulbaceae bacterium]